jgi:hypothetical protein
MLTLHGPPPQTLRVQQVDFGPSVGIVSASFCGGRTGTDDAVEMVALALSNTSVWFVPLGSYTAAASDGTAEWTSFLDLSRRIEVPTTFVTEGIDCFSHNGRFYGWVFLCFFWFRSRR